LIAGVEFARATALDELALAAPWTRCRILASRTDPRVSMGLHSLMGPTGPTGVRDQAGPRPRPGVRQSG